MPLRGTVDQQILVPQNNAASGAASTLVTQGQSGGSPALPVPGSRPGANAADEEGPDLSVQLSPPEDVEEDEVGGLITGTIGAIPEPEPDEEESLRTLRTEPVGALASGPGEPEEAPFAPVGLRIGTFDLTTSLDLGIGGSTTRAVSEDPGPPVSYAEQRSSGTLTEAGLVLLATSDWSRHALELGLEARYPFVVGGTSDDTPTIDATAELRLDLLSDTTLTATLGYSYATDNPSSQAVVDALDPVLFPDLAADGESAVHGLAGSLALARTAGPFIGQIEGSAGRQLHAAAKLTDGTSIAQDDLDFTRYGLRLRAGYQVSPVLTPFVEGEVSRRVMDETPDSGGFDRNATGYALRAGTAFDFGPKLNGELAVGYAAEDISDAALADIAGLSVSGEVNWSPRRGTDVALALSSAIAPGTSDADSGSVTYGADVAVTHRARADLELTASAGVEYEDVTGGSADALTAKAGLGATWWMNRYLGLTSRVLYERTFSSDPADETDSASAFLGLRLQR